VTTRLQIAVAGGGRCDARTARTAAAVGRAIADAGAVLVCGGRNGVMAAAARAAAAAGGVVVGVLPGYDHADANAGCSIVLPTGLGHARNVLVAAGGHALVALPGAHGTLSEMALARVLGRPVVVLGPEPLVAGAVTARTPAEAVATAVRLAARSRRSRRA
jgi:uncharacterized protein (TIGR00725 family)